VQKQQLSPHCCSRRILEALDVGLHLRPVVRHAGSERTDGDGVGLVVDDDEGAVVLNSGSLRVIAAHVGSSWRQGRVQPLCPGSHLLVHLNQEGTGAVAGGARAH
jgi:hypothetical protein